MFVKYKGNALTEVKGHQIYCFILFLLKIKQVPKI